MGKTSLSKNFGKRIRQLRKSRGMTLEMLSNKSSLSVRFIGHIERGTQSASLDTVDKLCSAFNFNPIEMFDFSEVTSNEIKQLEEIFFVLLRKASRNGKMQKVLKLMFTLLKEIY